ncbi:MAG: YfcC family protein [Alkalispirochaeta sp.]
MNNNDTPTTNGASMIRIGTRAFLLAFVIIFTLMIVSGVLTRIVPAGSYDRVEVDGRVQVVPGSFTYTDSPVYPIWRWATAPVEVLFAPGNVAVIAIILFLIFVGGSFTVLERGDVLGAFLRVIAVKMRQRRFLLMALMQLFFMISGAVLGIFEAMVPLIVFVVPLSHTLGWDSLTGLGMSLLPLAFGFAAAVTNPFTIGVAQTIAELPMFSGAWLRLPFLVIVYVIVLVFVQRHARRVEDDPRRSLVYAADRHIHERVAATGLSGELSAPLRRALVWFGVSMGLAVVYIIVTSRIPALSAYAFPLMAIFFLVGGIGSGRLSGLSWGEIGRAFRGGFMNMLPGVILILMSMSVKHIVQSGGIMDTILHSAATYISERPPGAAGFLMYLATLVMNFFIGSASAKAFLMMPILTPLADLVGITRQTAVLAFGFGDGFSNMLFPTNALLIIGLSFTTVSYPTWIRWTLPLQGIVFALSMVFLRIAISVGYGPF